MSLTQNKNYKHMSRNDSHDDADVSNSSSNQTIRQSMRIAANKKLQTNDVEANLMKNGALYSLPDDGKHVYNNVRLGISSKKIQTVVKCGESSASKNQDKQPDMSLL